MRSTEVERYSLWTELFTGLGAARMPMDTMRFYAWMHLLVVVPLVYTPVGLEIIRLRAGHSDLLPVGIAWALGAVTVAVANTAIIVLARRRPTAVSLAWYLTALVAVCNVATNLLSTYPVGLVASAASFYLAIIITIYRVGGDYDLGLVALISSVLGYVGIASLAELGVIAGHPASPEAIMPYYDIPPSPWVVVIPSTVGMLILFCTANYAVNQSLKLHRYLTNSVLRKYLPASLVERAARGELSDRGDGVVTRPPTG